MKSIITSVLFSLLLTTLTIPPLANAQLKDDQDLVVLLSPDPSFRFEFLVALGEAIFDGGSDIAPVLGAAKNITAGDFDSWTEVW